MHTPSFPGYAGTLTYYNPYSGDSVRSREHWLNYLSNASLAKYAADSVGCFLERTSRQQLQALDNATRSINGTLAHGFAGVQGGLVAVADEVRGLAVQQAQGNRLLALANAQLGELNQSVQQSNQLLVGINSRLALQLEEQRLGNELQENIAELLRIPDSEKKRHADIEWGLKFFKDASRDADLYHAALKYLLQAEAAMPEDYYVLRQIGFLHLYAPPLLDFEKAADYLIRAGKYASVDSHPDAVRLGHVLAKSVRRRLSDQPDASAADIARLAAETYRHAAAAEYALGKFPSAVKLIEKGAGLDPGADDLRFFQAKYLAADGKNHLALAALNTLTLSQESITAVANDLDLANTVGPLWLPDARLTLKRNLLSADKLRAEKQLEMRQQRLRNAEMLAVAAARQAEKRLELSGPAMKRAGFADAQISKLLTDGGTVVAWGVNGSGQTKVPAGLSGVVAIAPGWSHTVALKQDGTVVAWGNNDKGRTKVPAGLSGVVAIAAGDSHTVALKQDGTVVAGGKNDDGQTTVPAGLSGVVAIAAGVNHTVALKLPE